MTVLATGTGQSFPSGEYHVIVNSAGGAGTATFWMDVNGLGYQLVPEMSYTGSTAVIVDLPSCLFKVVIVGDSVVHIYPAE